MPASHQFSTFPWPVPKRVPGTQVSRLDRSLKVAPVSYSRPSRGLNDLPELISDFTSRRGLSVADHMAEDHLNFSRGVVPEAKPVVFTGGHRTLSCRPIHHMCISITNLWVEFMFSEGEVSGPEEDVMASPPSRSGA